MRAETILDPNLTRLIEQIDVVSDRDAAQTVLHGFTLSCGFQHFAYICTGGNEATALSDYPRPWKQSYVSRNLKAIDPVMRMARQSLKPFAWAAGGIPLNGFENMGFFEEAEQYGIGSGFSMPIPAGYGRMAMLTIASADREASEDVVVRNPVLAATAVSFVHSSLLRAAYAESGDAPARLTGREATCLSWASFGKKAPDIAELVGISVNTVHFHLGQACDRLDAANVAHAIRIAVERDLI